MFFALNQLLDMTEYVRNKIRWKLIACLSLSLSLSLSLCSFKITGLAQKVISRVRLFYDETSFVSLKKNSVRPGKTSIRENCQIKYTFQTTKRIGNWNDVFEWLNILKTRMWNENMLNKFFGRIGFKLFSFSFIV